MNSLGKIEKKKVQYMYFQDLGHIMVLSNWCYEIKGFSISFVVAC